jgi:hypothetical protein
MKLMHLLPHKKLREEELELPKHFQVGKRATQREKESPLSLKDHFQLSSLSLEEMSKNTQDTHLPKNKSLTPMELVTVS